MKETSYNLKLLTCYPSMVFCTHEQSVTWELVCIDEVLLVPAILLQHHTQNITKA